MPQVLQRAQQLRVLAHEEAVVSPTLQNSVGDARQGPGQGGQGHPPLAASPARLWGEGGRVGMHAVKGWDVEADFRREQGAVSTLGH